VLADRPKPHDWDLGNTAKPGDPANFSDFRYPYPHNHHHVLPNGVLNGCLENASAWVCQLMRRELLKAKYNLNHKLNMIMLPLGEQVARALGLPRHLRGYESRVGEPSEYLAHPEYSELVKSEVEKVINDFKEVFDKPTEDHPAVKGSLAKKKLERISIKNYERIIVFGKTAKGRPLDMMKPSDFLPS